MKRDEQMPGGGKALAANKEIKKLAWQSLWSPLLFQSVLSFSSFVDLFFFFLMLSSFMGGECGCKGKWSSEECQKSMLGLDFPSSNMALPLRSLGRMRNDGKKKQNDPRIKAVYLIPLTGFSCFSFHVPRTSRRKQKGDRFQRMLVCPLSFKDQKPCLPLPASVNN